MGQFTSTSQHVALLPNQGTRRRSCPRPHPCRGRNPHPLKSPPPPPPLAPSAAVPGASPGWLPPPSSGSAPGASPGCLPLPSPALPSPLSSSPAPPSSAPSSEPVPPKESVWDHAWEPTKRPPLPAQQTSPIQDPLAAFTPHCPQAAAMWQQALCNTKQAKKVSLVLAANVATNSRDPDFLPPSTTAPATSASRLSSDSSSSLRATTTQPLPMKGGRRV